MRAGTVAVLLILAGFLAPALTPAAPAAAKDDKRADIRFRLRVPPNATPGDHIGEILASVTGAETNSSGQRVNVERRVAARIYLRVAGPVHAVAELAAVDVRYDNPVMPFGGGDMTVTYRLTNSGNVIVTGVARIQVKGPAGRTRRQQRSDRDSRAAARLGDPPHRAALRRVPGRAAHRRGRRQPEDG